MKPAISRRGFLLLITLLAATRDAPGRPFPSPSPTRTNARKLPHIWTWSEVGAIGLVLGAFLALLLFGIRVVASVGAAAIEGPGRSASPRRPIANTLKRAVVPLALLIVLAGCGALVVVLSRPAVEEPVPLVVAPVHAAEWSIEGVFPGMDAAVARKRGVSFHHAGDAVGSVSGFVLERLGKPALRAGDAASRVVEVLGQPQRRSARGWEYDLEGARLQVIINGEAGEDARAQFFVLSLPARP